MKTAVTHGKYVAELVLLGQKNGPKPVRQHHVVPGLTTEKEWL
jgi:hypothetical protein